VAEQFLRVTAAALGGFRTREILALLEDEPAQQAREDRKRQRKQGEA
jgi:hypothetical protein